VSEEEYLRLKGILDNVARQQKAISENHAKALARPHSFEKTIATQLRRVQGLISKKSDHIAAHKHSSGHPDELQNSDVCGCFYCLEIYNPIEILDWVDEDESGVGQCALCPRCGIDAVIGSASGYPITKEFLQKMHDYWF